MLCLTERGVHYERYNDDSLCVFISAVTTSWREWSQRAQRVRQQAGEVHNECLGGPIYVGTKLRKEPKFLVKRVAASVFEPMLNVCAADTEEEWTALRDAAFAAAGIACIDVAKGQPFRRPETIAKAKGATRQEAPAEDSTDPVRNLAARFNGRRPSAPL